MQTYDFICVDDAIEKLRNLEKKNNRDRIIIWKIDFEKNSETKTISSADYGCRLAREAKSIIYNDDEYIPHLQLFTKMQESIRNIQRIGVMYDIFL